jgi:hypothetical protein
MLSKNEKDVYKDWTMLDFDLYFSLLDKKRELNEKAKKKLEEIRRYIESKEFIK